MKTEKFKQAFTASGLYFLFCFLPVFSFSQYILNGSATKNSCNCYTLTPAQNTQSGSVWNSNKISLNNTFDFTFNVYLGCQDSSGADGIVFILQPVSTSLGSSGEGMGFEGISPSIGIALDTWQNTNRNDPYYDHVSIQANGNVNHSFDLEGPVQAHPLFLNIEDCRWHTFSIKWNATTKYLEVYFDGLFRLGHYEDLVTKYFNNDPMVYWGFTGATGGANNLQQFCTSLNPEFKTNLTNNSSCFDGSPVTFRDTSVSFAPIQSWYWDFGDGATSTLQNPPPHVYASPGVYQVKQVITGMDGCTSDTLEKNVTIGSKPVAVFEVFDTCAGKSPRVNDLSSNAVGTINQWTWLVDDAVVSAIQQPIFTNITAGPHQLRLVVKSVIGCESDTAFGTFLIKPSPQIDVMAPNGCLNQPINFSGVQLDNATSINQWNWNFGDGSASTLQNPVHSFSPAGLITVQLNATATNGCSSPVVSKTINVAFVNVQTINDTTVLPDFSFRIGASWLSNSSRTPTFTWSPATGLNNPVGPAPTATLKNDITYVVTAATVEGCTDSDTVNIKVFKGSAIYVPTGFTPNNDGRNDVLRPLYIGITKIYFFRVYNRWGQLVFRSGKPGEGWDGEINGVPQPMGTYVWLLKAEDMAGKIYEMKGMSTIIR
jgi:gliding motility-associated-like protein